MISVLCCRISPDRITVSPARANIAYPATTRAAARTASPRCAAGPRRPGRPGSAGAPPARKRTGRRAPRPSATGPGQRRAPAASALIVPAREGPVGVEQQHALRQSPTAGRSCTARVRPGSGQRRTDRARRRRPDSASRSPQPTIRSAATVSRRYPGSRAGHLAGRRRAARSRTGWPAPAGPPSGASSVNVPKKGRSQRRSPGGRVQAVRGLVLQHHQRVADEARALALQLQGPPLLAGRGVQRR